MKNSRQYQIINFEPVKAIVTVEGRKVTIPGYAEFDFFLHQSAQGTGYTVSEMSTGLSVSTCYAWKTQKQAIEKAIETIAKCAPTPAKLLAIIAKNQNDDVLTFNLQQAQ